MQADLKQLTTEFFNLAETEALRAQKARKTRACLLDMMWQQADREGWGYDPQKWPDRWPQLFEKIAIKL